jgi:hypothetical protein
VLEALGLAVKDVDYYFLRTTTSVDPTRYGSLSDANSALEALIVLQEGRGFTTQKNPSGRYMSEHPDKPMVMFWIEGEDGEIVRELSR